MTEHNVLLTIEEIILIKELLYDFVSDAGTDLKKKNIFFYSKKIEDAYRLLNEKFGKYGYGYK